MSSGNSVLRRLIPLICITTVFNELLKAFIVASQFETKPETFKASANFIQLMNEV